MAQTAEVGSFMATFSNFHIWQVFPSDIKNMKETDTAEYEGIIGGVRKQKIVTVLFKDIIEIRKKLEADPSTSGEVLKNSLDLLDCIDIFSSGK